MADTPDDDPLKALLQRHAAALRRLRRQCTAAELQGFKPMVLELRNARQYPELLQLAEAIHRRDPDDPVVRRLHAQALIETGQATVAIDVLQALGARLEKGHSEWAEVHGLLGRAWKQIFFDSLDKGSPAARRALTSAIAAYRVPHEANPANTWHGVNLLALAHRAQRDGLALSPEIDVQDLARRLLATLAQTPSEDRDEWYLPTVAEVSLGTDDWDEVERNLRLYLEPANTPAFLIASTLRQFRDIWEVDRIDERGSGIVQLLSARLLKAPDSQLTVDVATLRQQAPAPPAGQPEAVLGLQGPVSMQWWNAGQDRAVSVGAVRRRIGERVGDRIGTCFLVRAGDFGQEPADELMALTNYHVINDEGLPRSLRPADAVVVFEASKNPLPHRVTLVWHSGLDRHDASLLRLDPAPSGLQPLPLAPRLPDWPCSKPGGAPSRVYIIGHPLGGELAISFQDNKLLGHEGPPSGKPAVPGVCRVHYEAPTHPGSSGSPVFDEDGWQVIALHHLGGKMGMTPLNGETGSYGANEGISIDSIRKAADPKGLRPSGT
jgi:hypothetical protein